ncbi:hypothetical protein CR513_32713, partial [Mucuna pruriens]
MKNISYAFAVGILMYAQVCTRSDIAYVVGTSDLEVIAYSNSNYDSRKSTYGYVFMLTDGAVSWRSVKQTLIVTSIMEVEFVSCFETTLHGVWLKSFISKLRVVNLIFKPLKLYCDKSIAMFMTKNNKNGSRSKHIDIKYLAMRKCVKEKNVVIEHVSTKLMIVDPLIKGMPPKNFKDHVVRMRLGSMT